MSPVGRAGRSGSRRGPGSPTKRAARPGKQPSAIRRARLPKAHTRLIRAAARARRRAYAPYSQFPVGAAVLANDGSIYVGCNVENASYGLTLCAERVAIHTAVANGRRRLTAVAVVGPTGITLSPCGACRQVMEEFGVQTVILASPRGAPTEIALPALLPSPFPQASTRGRHAGL